MSSTFHGLETAKRGMLTQQKALYVTGHNIANANTPGFSRQRVNFEQTEPYPAAAMNRPQIPGQMGTGVKAGAIERVRDKFLDAQFRTEYNKLGYYGARADALSKMENIMNEPSENGLSAVFGEFWQSLQDLSTYPENEGTRQVVLQRAKAVVDTFHYLSDSLTTIKKDYENEININVDEINNIMEEIANLNRQIGGVEPHGYLPNDLYDQRDLLVDELSKHLNIKVVPILPGGNANEMAVGQYQIKLLDADGVESIDLVNQSQYEKFTFSISGDTGTVDDKSGKPILSSGKLKGLIQSINEIYPDMINDLDKVAYSFAKEFNNVHKLGFDLKGNQGSEEFFMLDTTKGEAEGISLGNIETWQIAASSKDSSNAGDGQNALYLADIFSKALNDPNGVDGTINSFYEGMIGTLGADAMQANRLVKNSQILSDSVNENRMSVSSVSLDEEMTNIIKFQHAYNAAARQITAVDEMLDKIINGMGLVGR